MKKSIKFSIIGCSLAAIMAYGLWSHQPKVNEEIAGKKPGAGASAGRPGGQGRPLNVNAIVMQPQLLTDEYVTTGLVMPDEEVDLSFETSGKIVSVSFKEGTRVSKGQLLAKVNDKPLQAQLKRLMAQLELAKNRVFRQKQLLKKDGVSQETSVRRHSSVCVLSS